MAQPDVQAVGDHYNISGSGGTFTIPGLGDENYWLKVDKTTGNIQIWNQNVGVGQDADVGTLNPNTGEISFYSNKSYTINGNEVHEDKIFSTKETQAFIISQARQTVINNKTAELIAKGETPKVAAQMAELEATKILGSNASTGEQTTETSVNTDGFILKEKVIATQRDEMAGKPGTHLVYPQDHADGDFDFIKIVPIEYVPQINSTSTWSNGLIDLKQRYRQRERVVGATMFLPMVPGINESNQVDWGGDSLNPIQLAAGQVAANTIRTPGGPKEKAKTFIEQSRATIDTIAGDNAGIRSFLTAYFAGKAVNANLLGRAGIVVNPNLEVLFNGPKLRTFSYSFTFTPRDDRESRTVKTIIKVIKKAMAPKRRKAAIFLNVPSVFKIKYLMQGKRDHPFLNKIKPCALTGFNVDYTPGGSYMTYGDGSMTSYGVSLNFAELEPIYNDDVVIDSPDMGY
jgi:hypothetical protein